MTRYTKLEGRRREHLPASNYFVASDDDDDDEPSTPSVTKDAPAQEQEASTSTAGEGGKASGKKAAKPAAKRSRGDDEGGEPTQTTTGDAAGSSNAAVTSPDDADPSRLQKRAKLLRLKAKKAKNETRKKELEGKARQLDKEAARINGLRGANKGAKEEGKERTSKKAKTATAGDDGKPKETNPWKVMEAERRAKTDERREARREKRLEERKSTLRCFACRGMGHSAKDCPASLNAESELLEGASGEAGTKGLGGEALDATGPSAAELEAKRKAIKGRETVGICFRCGSTEHTLAKCRRPTPRVGPELPFATCFICGDKGHLASKCAANQGRGVYPLGGSCKLCSSVEHLAKDCPLRAPSTGAAALNNASMGFASSTFAGPGSGSGNGNGGGGGNGRGRQAEVGADEDDFMHLSRVKAQVDREVKRDSSSKVGKKGSITAPPGAKTARGATGAKKVVSF